MEVPLGRRHDLIVRDPVIGDTCAMQQQAARRLNGAQTFAARNRNTLYETRGRCALRQFVQLLQQRCKLDHACEQAHRNGMRAQLCHRCHERMTLRSREYARFDRPTIPCRRPAKIGVACHRGRDDRPQSVGVRERHQRDVAATRVGDSHRSSSSKPAGNVSRRFAHAQTSPAVSSPSHAVGDMPKISSVEIASRTARRFAQCGCVDAIAVAVDRPHQRIDPFASVRPRHRFEPRAPSRAEGRSGYAKGAPALSRAGPPGRAIGGRFARRWPHRWQRAPRRAAHGGTR